MSKLKIVGVTLLTSALILLGTAFVGGLMTGQNLILLTYDKIIGKKTADNDREIFKEGKAYVEGTIKELSKLKLEYETSDDEVAKKAIANHIRELTANFDINKIDNRSLRQFVININGGL